MEDGATPGTVCVVLHYNRSNRVGEHHPHIKNNMFLIKDAIFIIPDPYFISFLVKAHKLLEENYFVGLQNQISTKAARRRNVT